MLLDKTDKILNFYEKLKKENLDEQLRIISYESTASITEKKLKKIKQIRSIRLNN